MKASSIKIDGASVALSAAFDTAGLPSSSTLKYFFPFHPLEYMVLFSVLFLGKAGKIIPASTRNEHLLPYFLFLVQFFIHKFSSQQSPCGQCAHSTLDSDPKHQLTVTVISIFPYCILDFFLFPSFSETMKLYKGQVCFVLFFESLSYCCTTSFCKTSSYMINQFSKHYYI